MLLQRQSQAAVGCWMVVSLWQFHRGRSGRLPSEGGVGGSQGGVRGVGGSRGETCETLTPEQLRFRRLQKNRLKNLAGNKRNTNIQINQSRHVRVTCTVLCQCMCVCVCACCRGVTLTGAWPLPVRGAVHDGKSSCWWEFQTWQLLVQNSQLGPDGLPPTGRDARYSKLTNYLNMQSLISTSRQKLHSHRLR